MPLVHSHFVITQCTWDLLFLSHFQQVNSQLVLVITPQVHDLHFVPLNSIPHFSYSRPQRSSTSFCVVSPSTFALKRLCARNVNFSTRFHQNTGNFGAKIIHESTKQDFSQDQSLKDSTNNLPLTDIFPFNTNCCHLPFSSDSFSVIRPLQLKVLLPLKSRSHQTSLSWSKGDFLTWSIISISLFYHSGFQTS